MGMSTSNFERLQRKQQTTENGVSKNGEKRLSIDGENRLSLINVTSSTLSHLQFSTDDKFVKLRAAICLAISKQYFLHGLFFLNTQASCTM